MLWAIFHTPVRKQVWVEPPAEWPNPNEEAWALNYTVYALKEVMVDFDNHFGDALSGRVEDDGKVSIKTRKHFGDPASWSGASVYMAKHVDDGTMVGPIKRVDKVLEDNNMFFKLQVTDILGSGKPGKFLGGFIYKMTGYGE